METAQIVALRVAPPPRSRPPVDVEGDVIVIDRLRVEDRTLAAFVDSRPESDRPEMADRALRIGLHALQDAGTTLDVEFVRREFDALVEHNTSVNERAAKELDQVLRLNFADREGRLPRMLEQFLGDRGQLTRLVSELFDENKRDSAIGRLRTLLGAYFDGDASRLAQLLDPTRMGAPLYQFRTEMNSAFEKLNERLTAIEAAATARAVERSKSSAKGRDFEELLDEMLAEAVRGTGDTVDRTGDAAGDVIRSKKGDFLLTIDPQWCGGAELRVVIEAKNRGKSWREMREELTAAKRNRGAAAALAVFTPEHAPAGVAPFDVRFGHVFAVIDPDAPDMATLAAAVRLARLHALASVATHKAEIDPARITAALAALKTELEAVRALKVSLTSIKSTADNVALGLDRLRDQVLGRVAEAETALTPKAI
ncbi:MAG TPA: hypothetical protein VM284_05980 [Candidatus Limnocylindria bacterium]|nr:hypothetical protein [Candidatus Limnocylindria bacterium]